MTMSECSTDSWPQGYKASTCSVEGRCKAGIGACLRSSGKDIALVPGTSEGASFGRGGRIFVVGIGKERERAQNARKDTSTAVAWRVSYAGVEELVAKGSRGKRWLL